MSGGQRQRLAIARAILMDPPILIFDDATSSVDAETEKLIQEGLNLLGENRTLIIITHRLSTLKYASRIVILDNGKVVQDGTHDELIRQEGLYKDFIEYLVGQAKIKEELEILTRIK